MAEKVSHLHDPDITTNNLVRRIVEYVEANPAGDLHQKTIATQFEISVVTLSKLFKEKYNCTFSKYVEQFRMKLAYRLIAKESRLIKEVMYLCGYHSRSTFANTFKKYFNKLPSDFK